mgnify:CR=1 FL=1
MPSARAAFFIMSSKTTAYWAEQIAQYEAENPKARGVPSELKEKYKKEIDELKEEIETLKKD